jgi:hypothetical protein
VITLADLYERLPTFTKGHKPANIQATDVYVFVGGKTPPTGITVQQGGNHTALNPAADVGAMKSFSVTALTGCAMDTWQISLLGTNPTLESSGSWRVTYCSDWIQMKSEPLAFLNSVRAAGGRADRRFRGEAAWRCGGISRMSTIEKSKTTVCPSNS